MKRNGKRFFILLIFVSFIFLLQNLSLAAAWNPVTDGLNKVDGWVDSASNDGGIANSTQRVVGTIVNVIRIVGTGIAVIMLTYVAIKYMSAAPTEKAEFKKSATAMIVGAIVLFAATNILTVIANFAVSNIKVS